MMNLTISESEVATAYLVYEKYIAIKNHFEKKYNYFKYNGRILKHHTSALDKFKKSKNYYPSRRVWFAHKDLEEIEKLFIFNYIENQSFWIGSVDEKIFNKTLGRYNKLDYHFINDLKILFSTDDFKNVFNISDDYQESRAFYLYTTDKISIETIIICNFITKFLNKLYTKTDDFIFKEKYEMINKYKDFFIKYNKIPLKNYKEIFSTVYNERCKIDK